MIVWDGDPLERTGFTNIVPKFLENDPQSKALAFVLDYEVDDFKESWEQVIEKYPNRIRVVAVDLKPPTWCDAVDSGIMEELKALQDQLKTAEALEDFIVYAPLNKKGGEKCFWSHIGECSAPVVRFQVKDCCRSKPLRDSTGEWKQKLNQPKPRHEGVEKHKAKQEALTKGKKKNRYVSSMLHKRYNGLRVDNIRHKRGGKSKTRRHRSTNYDWVYGNRIRRLRRLRHQQKIAANQAAKHSEKALATGIETFLPLNKYNPQDTVW